MCVLGGFGTVGEPLYNILELKLTGVPMIVAIWVVVNLFTVGVVVSLKSKNNINPPVLNPSAPFGPISPVGPVEPVNPVEPVGPVGPVVPVGPVCPVEPVGPVNPVVPVGPVGPVVPVGPV
jgi:hypothetical protein